jgi:hypothetical protein
MDDVWEIRQLIEKWVVYRDAFMWDEFRKVWHKEGTMKATWLDAHYETFIETTDNGVKYNNLNILHMLGGSVVDVNGNRAVSITKFSILQRAVVEGVLCDVTCWARHYDLWEKREGRWGLVSRDTICDKDRIDPVDTNATLLLDKEILDKYPAEYRHLAYLQEKAGYDVDKNAPCQSRKSALDDLYKKGQAWLEGIY